MNRFSRSITVLLWGLIMVGLVYQASSLRPDPTLRTLIPAGDETLQRQVAFFEDQAASRLLYLEADSDDAGEALAVLREAARHLEALGAKPVAPPGQGDPNAPPADLRASIRLDDAVHRHLPVLLPPRVLADLPERLEHAALVDRLREARRFLLQPGNELWAGRVYRDVLGLEDSVVATIAGGYVGIPHSITHDGVLRHDDGRHHVLVCEVVFPPDHQRRTLELMAGVDRLARAADERDVTLVAVGAYPHFADHFERLHSDLMIAIPASILLIFALLWTLYRKKRDILAAHLPAFAAVAAGGAATTAVFGPQLPLAVLVFSGAVLGVAVDYGIHMTRAVRDGRSDLVLRPLTLGFATTACAFATLFASSVPALRVLALGVVAGLAAALLTALLVLPRLLRRRQQRDPWAPVAEPLVALTHRLRGWGLIVVVLLTAAVVPGLLRLQPEGQIADLSGSRRATQHVHGEFLERWGGTGGDAFLVATGSDRASAVERIQHAREAFGLPLGSPELLLPSPAEQERRLAAWTATMTMILADLEERLQRAAGEAGLRARAFAPSLRSYRRTECQAVTAATWSDTAVGPDLARLIASEDGRVRIISPVIGDPGATLSDARHPVAESTDDGAWLASRARMTTLLQTSMLDELLWRGLFLVIAVAVVLAVVMRRIGRTLAVLVPPLVALVWTFGIFGYLGIQPNALHLLIAAFVTGVGIDDAIFLSRADLRRHVMSPILATTATTTAGVGALALAGHPALYELGVGVIIGMGCCLSACLLITPSFDFPNRRTVSTLRANEIDQALQRRDLDSQHVDHSDHTDTARVTHPTPRRIG